MKNSILLFFFLVPVFLFAQYPTTGNKSRLGWQTTGDGLIWRGVAGDTVNKPNNRNYPYFQLDTVNSVLYRYIQTRGKWQEVGGGVDIDSLIYATRYWVNSNFFPLQGGTLTGTGGNGFVGFPLQSSPPSTPSTGFSLYAGSTGNNISWMQPDGFFRRLVSPVTGTPRQYQFMARSYTLGDSADIANNVTSIAANYLATSNGTNLVARNLFDDDSKVEIKNGKPLKPGQWTTAGRPGSVNGYMGYNTSFNWLDIYSSSGWFSPARAATTGGAFTAGYIPFGGTGGLTENADLFLTRTGSVTRVSINNSTANNSGLALLTGGALKYSLAAYQSGTGNIDFTVYNEQTNKFTILVDGTTDFIGYGIPYSPTYTPRYAIDISSTDAFALPRGTVAQRPTIASSTTPFRYNTDSTALEYGESVGTWRQVATRAYARSLDTWLGTRLGAGNVRIDANANTFTIDTLTRFTISATNHTSEFGTAQIAQIKKLNAAGTKYFDNYRQYDSRSSIANGTNVNVGPSYSEVFIYNRGGGEEYEWTDMHTLDTTNNVFGHRYGAQYKAGFVSFRSLRPSAAGVYKLTPNFSFRVEPGGNGVAGSPVLSVFTSSDSLFSVKQNGSIEADKYGAGNKEAADLSKTVSAYASVYATDGTLLEYPLADLGGSSILDSLPNGSISIDANGNSLNISNLDELTFTGYSADIRGQNSRLLLDDDDATLSADNNVDISAAGELTLTGLVVALQEAYNEVTSTTSPDTLSSVYSDNLINQGGTQATFTLVLPPSPIDGQVCTITYVNNITTLTLDGNGTTVIGSAVTTGVPGSQRKYKYYAAAGAWVKIY